MTDTTLFDEYAEYIDRGMGREEITEKIMDRAVADEQFLREHIRPLVWSYWSHVKRQHVRAESGASDVAAEKANDDVVAKQRSTPKRLLARRQLSEIGFFALGEYVTWGQATVAHHLDAEKVHRAHADGHEQKAERHGQTARDLVKAGFDSLDEMAAVKGVA